jgi:hypothetical protein
VSFLLFFRLQVQLVLEIYQNNGMANAGIGASESDVDLPENARFLKLRIK